MRVALPDEAIANENAATRAGSRLDEILTRHRRRRAHALAALLVWALFGAVILAM